MINIKYCDVVYGSNVKSFSYLSSRKISTPSKFHYVNWLQSVTMLIYYYDDPNTHISWYRNANNVIIYKTYGSLHREDGPAIIHPDGTKKYYLTGVRFGRRKYWHKVRQIKATNGIFYHLNDENRKKKRHRKGIVNDY